MNQKFPVESRKFLPRLALCARYPTATPPPATSSGKIVRRLSSVSKGELDARTFKSPGCTHMRLGGPQRHHAVQTNPPGSPWHLPRMSFPMSSHCTPLPAPTSPLAPFCSRHSSLAPKIAFCPACLARTRSESRRSGSMPRIAPRELRPKSCRSGGVVGHAAPHLGPTSRVPN